MHLMNLLSLVSAPVVRALKRRPSMILQRGLAAAAVALSLTVIQSAPAAGFSYTGSPTTLLFDHRATLLTNGLVLVVGGDSSGKNAELYDPATGTWTNTGSMAAARSYHTATLLTNGLLLVAGGYNGSGFVSSAELYDPASGTWTNTGSLAAARMRHRATLLTNGQVLVAGGDGSGAIFTSAELYDPASDTWTITGSMASGRTTPTATLLTNGLVLVAGGFTIYGVTNSAELYDPASGTWTNTSSMAITRDSYAATLLSNGQVLVTGGLNNHTYVLSSAELYDPASGTWTNTGSMATMRYFHTATLLPNGQVLVAGGEYGTVTNSAELYDPLTYIPFPSTPRPVSVRLTVNFVPGKLEQASVKASFALPTGFSLTNRTATLTVGGAAVDFPLSDKGLGVNGSSRVKISVKINKSKTGGPPQTIGTLTATLKGNWETWWTTCGLINETVTNKAVTVPVRLVFDTPDPTAFSIDQSLVYKAKAGKSGQAK